MEVTSEIIETIRLAVQKFKREADQVYKGKPIELKMAELHSVAHEIVDRQIAKMAQREPDVTEKEVEETKRDLARLVHLLIEKER